MPKATYMYWQKRFDRENPDKELEEKIQEIRKNNKDYGYRRIQGELRNQGYRINKKKIQRIVQKLGLQVTSYTRKSRKYSSYKGKVGTVAPNRIRRRFNTNIPHQKITTDTTEFKYYEVDAKGHMTMHKLYLDPFMDMCNGDKTDNEIYVTTHLCSRENAYKEFELTKKQFNSRTKTLAHHLIQSFVPEDVSFEEAHQMVIELCEKILGGKYKYVLATHIDKDHIHNHIIFNSIYVDEGKVYHSYYGSYMNIRN